MGFLAVFGSNTGLQLFPRCLEGIAERRPSWKHDRERWLCESDGLGPFFFVASHLLHTAVAAADVIFFNIWEGLNSCQRIATVIHLACLQVGTERLVWFSPTQARFNKDKPEAGRFLAFAVP